MKFRWLDHDLLMIPGPSEPYHEALAVLSKPVLPHYGPQWREIYADTQEKLKAIFGTDEDVIMLPGAGAASLELAVANVVEPGDKALVVHDGFFTDIFRQLVETYEGTPVLVTEEYGRAVRPEMVAQALERNRNVKAMFIVHSETSTGVKHDIEAFGKIAEQYDLFHVVDAVSSFGGMELRVDDWNIDMCVGYPSKALGAINGVVPIAIKDRIWEYVKSRKSKVRSRFYDLKLWRKCMDEWAAWGHPFPTSMSTPVIMALRRAAELALEEGLENRFWRHRACKMATRRALQSLGLEPLVDEEEDASNTISSVKLPAKLNAASLISLMSDRFNILVGSLNLIGLNGLRLAHMGQGASPHHLLPTFFALEHVLHETKWEIRKGEAVSALAEKLHELLGWNAGYRET